MRFDRLDLNLLVTLDGLIEHRSVSAAARRLNITQPSVSSALQRLRDFFEDELLVQVGRRMVLTPKAEALAGPVRRALTLIRSEITRPAGFDAATAERHFIIVASDYAYAIVLADAIAAAGRAAPGVTFEVVATDRRAFDRFERLEIDLFITVEPLLLEEHPHRTLFTDDEVVICWSEGPFAGGIDEPAFFSAGHAIAVFGEEKHPALAELFLARQQSQRRIELRVPSFTALPQAVVGSARIATMHRRFAEHFARLYPIRLHPLPIAMPPIVEEVQWHRLRDRDEGVRWFLDLLSAQARSLPAPPGGYRLDR